MTAHDHRQDGCATWTGNILTMAEVGKINEAYTADRTMSAPPETLRDLLCTLYAKENALQISKMSYERSLEERRLERSGVVIGRDVCFCCLKANCDVEKARKARA